MKKVLFAVLVLGAMASCKKDKKNNCESTVTGIAGNYKLTKVEGDFPSPLPDQDLTSSIPDCAKNGVYALKADKTFTYTESGTCTDAAAGTWDIVSNKITVTFTSGSATTIADLDNSPITSWDCTTFIVSEDQGGSVTYKYSFTKQ